MPLTRPIIAAVLASLCSTALLAAEQAQPLPQPLTLADALNHAHTSPLESLAEAGRDAAQAQLLSAESISGTRLTASATARAVEPSYVSPDRDSNDSRASLSLSRRLYDFGYSDALEDAARSALVGSEHGQLHARQQAQLQIMRAFYDVLLADLEFARDNELMSVAFIRADRARDRNEIGQMSDVDMLEAEADYQEVRRQRFASETRQLLSRSRLALAMGRPNDLASDLVMPVLALPEPQALNFEDFWQQVLAGSPELLALRAGRDAARDKIEAARNAHGPVLSGEIDASVYNRSTASTHPVGVGLRLEVPLLTGGAGDAAVAEALAASRHAEAELRAAELRLRQQALELWMGRNDIRADVQAFEAQADFRDLYLDRSRALYELELRTDLGDAMARTSEVRLKHAGALFEWAMTEARLKAMTGSLLEETP